MSTGLSVASSLNYPKQRTEKTGMTRNQITDVRAIEMIDNRGNPTIRTYVTIDHHLIGIADVPSGSSTGSFEAKELRDGEIRSDKHGQYFYHRCGQGYIQAGIGNG
jgi:Enolase, N-terminal domain